MTKCLKENLYVRYIVVAIASFGLDIMLFSVFDLVIDEKFKYSIIISSFLARLISALFNYLLNKYFVFRYNAKQTFLKYWGLVILNVSLSAISVELIYSVFPIWSTIIKSVIDLLIFIMNFLIQKYWIFKRP